MFQNIIKKGSIFVIEPGYYEDGNFGIRIETAVVVINATTPVSLDNEWGHQTKTDSWVFQHSSLV